MLAQFNRPRLKEEVEICQSCLGNSHCPSGYEKEAKVQVYGFWLCGECDRRIKKLPHGLRVLRSLAGSVTTLNILERNEEEF